MKKKVLLFIALISSMSASMSYALEQYSVRNPAYSLDDKLVLGQEEQVYFSSVKGLEKVPFIAKIDTGADSTSINATDIEIRTHNRKLSHLKDGVLLAAIVNVSKRHTELWLEKKSNQTLVAFNLVNPYSGKTFRVERPLIKVSQIKSRSSNEPILRPLVSMPISIAGKTFDTVVNLTDRSHFSAQVLIGRTLLKHKAWVFGGYRYLQEQPNAILAGRKERISIGDVMLNAEVSMKYNFSRLTADKIQVSPNHKQVTFELAGKNHSRQSFSLPVARMLKVSGDMKPLVYLPVELNSTHRQYWLAYLTHSGKGKSKMRIGRDVISQHLMIEADKEYLFKHPLTIYSQRKPHDQELLISPQERLQLDGNMVQTTVSTRISTPILRVSSLSVSDNKQTADYIMAVDGDKVIEREGKVKRWVKIGRSRYPVVQGKVTILGHQRPIEFALKELGSDEKTPYLTLGRKLGKTELLINPRVDYLLTEHPLFRAGHIEKVQVEGMTFSAKLDTGADVSSISAENIKLYKEDAKQMVRFLYRDKQGNKKEISLPVVKMMHIKAKKGEKANARPVVRLPVQLGKLKETIEVNLQDRSRFDYSMILGQNFLKYGVLVGSDKNYLLGK
ncbi:RimK/LysX family protein [Vibrio sp. S4M6]|uniref:putative ATP-dependent zinc protease n=1 Tax=Vibrio sinus TaxID=2946865 RepID=UPI00202A0BA5|nr:RimK/LysX family protein [Vibrio sinus]MCL9780328.1 RimK/LysX family protein [Vibrio sinus]